MKLELPVRVSVTWLDALSDPHASGLPADLPETDPKQQTVETVAWLVAVGRQQLLLATDVAVLEDGKPVKVVHRIPRAWVQGLRLLEPGPPVSLMGRAAYRSRKKASPTSGSP